MNTVMERFGIIIFLMSSAWLHGMESGKQLDSFTAAVLQGLPKTDESLIAVFAGMKYHDAHLPHKSVAQILKTNTPGVSYSVSAGQQTYRLVVELSNISEADMDPASESVKSKILVAYKDQLISKHPYRYPTLIQKNNDPKLCVTITFNSLSELKNVVMQQGVQTSGQQH